MANLEDIITERRLRWLGHVIWMEDCSIPNQAFNWNLSSRNRKPGRPRKNWQDIIWMDLGLHCKAHRSWRQRVSSQWFLFSRTALDRSRKAVSCFLLRPTDSLLVFTARCYASAVLAMGLCLCLSVCLSQVGVLLKRLNVGSHKQHHTIAQEL